MPAAGGFVLSVVVGTLNRLERLRECITSIVSEATIPVRIYVTDAGSNDGTVDYLRLIESESISVTLHQKRLGQARAYNEIFEKISTPYTCWLSDDNVVVNRGLEKAVRILDTNPRIGMVGLKVKDVQGPFAGEPYIGGISEAGILNVNQGVLRTEILHGLGGFSEEFMDYGIDPDLTARVLYAGHDVVYTKEVAVLHWRDWGESEILQAQMERQQRYKELYRSKYAHAVPGNYAAWHRIGALHGSLRLLGRISKSLGSPRAECWARDWYNIILGRYISVLDLVRSMGQDYYLLQRCDHQTVEHYENRLREGVR